LPLVLLGGLLAGTLARWGHDLRLRSYAGWQFYMLVLWACATSGIYSHFIALVYFWLPLSLILGRALFRRLFNA